MATRTEAVRAAVPPPPRPPRKPVGGLVRVWLAWRRSAASDGSFAACELLEDRSSYEERSEGGLVRHSLRLVLDEAAAAALCTPVWCRRAQREGVAARIETASGLCLETGRSERFGTECPLRLAAVEYRTGSRRSDLPTVTLVFECEDDEGALPPAGAQNDDD